tara:strand:+ start:798 stop:1172 length:375 start_codon:yes stop_codon:yes gene_type:complete
MDRDSFIMVFIGGMLGACARWGLIELLPTAGIWPWQIFLINVVGCGLLGVLIGGSHLKGQWFAGATTGFCGAFTTFSAFSVDLAEFIRGERFLISASYLFASISAGLLAYVFAKQSISARMDSK